MRGIMKMYSIYSNDDLEKSRNCTCGRCSKSENLKPIWHSLPIGFTDKLDSLKSREIPETIKNPVVVEFSYVTSDFKGKKISNIFPL